MSASESTTPRFYADALAASPREVRATTAQIFRGMLAGVEVTVDFLTCAVGMFAAYYLEVSLHLANHAQYPTRAMTAASVVVGLLAMLFLRWNGAYRGGAATDSPSTAEHTHVQTVARLRDSFSGRVDAGERARLVERHLDVAKRAAVMLHPRVRGYIELDELIALTTPGSPSAGASLRSSIAAPRFRRSPGIGSRARSSTACAARPTCRDAWAVFDRRCAPRATTFSIAASARPGPRSKASTHCRASRRWPR